MISLIRNDLNKVNQRPDASPVSLILDYTSLSEFAQIQVSYGSITIVSKKK